MANPVKKYTLSEEELKKYQDLKPPKIVKDIKTTAYQRNRGRSGRWQ
ncbi:hypothetical protein [Gorillibacterium sp. sgz5001074]